MFRTKVIVMSPKVRVLIVDDSVVYRSQIQTALSYLPEVKVVGTASNGKIALEKLEQIDVDLLILDLEMPEMNGIQTLRELRKRNHLVKVLVFSSGSRKGSEVTIEALLLGAKDFATKPSKENTERKKTDNSSEGNSSPSEIILNLLKPKIQALFPKQFEPKVEDSKGKEFLKNLKSTFSVATKPKITKLHELKKPDVIVIGSSTGGPNALDVIFKNLNGSHVNFPILIAQHMPILFTAALAERLARISGLNVKEAVHGEPLVNGFVYIAPGDYHMRLVKKEGVVTISLDQSEKIHYVRPAVDPLFSSAAEIYKQKCMGIVLTGMGYDGQQGALDIKKQNGTVVIQSEDSCVVYGMPKAVYQAQAYDAIASLEDISSVIGGGVKNAA